MLSNPLIDELNHSGLLDDCSDITLLVDALNAGPVRVYAGFDPTAASLHAGHLVTLRVLSLFARHGHEVLPLVGTATARVGDPTGRSAARPLLAADDIRANADGIESQILHLLADAGRDARLPALRNEAWLLGMDLMSFLTEVARKIPASRLSSLLSNQREEGVSMLEFMYPLLQGYDFLAIAQRADNVLVQVGGSDQWGNICVGLELCEKNNIATAVGMTHSLLVDSQNRKMGKTAGGRTVWLDAERTPVAEFYQFWRTMPDADVGPVARMLLGSTGEAGNLDALKDELAFSMTQWVHGEQRAQAARLVSSSRGRGAEGHDVVMLDCGAVRDVLDAAVALKLSSSRAASRRLVQQGGLYLNGSRIAETDLNLPSGEAFTMSAGKTRHAAGHLT